MRSYDLAVIGSGPGGYVAALYAARHKLKACIIEQGLLGGTCLNKGCIPTKSLLNSVSIIPKLKNISNFGIALNGYSIDFKKMALRKDEVVSRLRKGIETLLKANRIEIINGTGILKSADTIAISGQENVTAKMIIIATGSRAAELPNIKIDNDVILSSDSMLDIKSPPGSLIIVGGGVIGCEFASIFNKLGTNVTIVEMAERIMPGQSREVSRRLEYNFKKSGINILTSSVIETAEIKDNITVKMSGGQSVSGEKVLISIGRKPNIEGIGLEDVGIRVRDGNISVNEKLMTDLPNVYAIGDCVSGPQLAHKASYDGILACDNIMGLSRIVDYSGIPNCIWTDPEIASVGLTEESAKAISNDVKIAKFPYLASGKAYIEGETDGFVKIVGTPAGDILGVEIFGKDACNLIGEAALAMARHIKICDWGRVVHGHPTLSEIFPEACHVFMGTPIHIMQGSV